MATAFFSNPFAKPITPEEKKELQTLRAMTRSPGSNRTYGEAYNLGVIAGETMLDHNTYKNQTMQRIHVLSQKLKATRGGRGLNTRRRRNRRRQTRRN